MGQTLGLTKRWGDKPYRASPTMLNEFDDGKYKAELKIDGWRGQAHIGSEVIVVSTSDNVLPVSAEIIDQLNQLDIARPALLDVEWADRREFALHHNRLWLLDILELAGEWMGDLEFRVRDEILNQIEQGGLPERISRPEGRYKGFEEFYEYSKTLPWTEGLVIKALDSTIVGDPKDHAKNRDWIKIKWRD